MKHWKVDDFLNWLFFYTLYEKIVAFMSFRMAQWETVILIYAPIVLFFLWCVLAKKFTALRYRLYLFKWLGTHMYGYLQLNAMYVFSKWLPFMSKRTRSTKSPTFFLVVMSISLTADVFYTAMTKNYILSAICVGAIILVMYMDGKRGNENRGNDGTDEEPPDDPVAPSGQKKCVSVG